VSLTFVAGPASEVFDAALARAVEEALHAKFSFEVTPAEPYRSDPVDARGWLQLQRRAADLLGGPAVPHLVNVDAYQAVYVPFEVPEVQHLPIANAADPLQVAPLAALLAELLQFATAASLPTDDVELMQLAAHYLEDDELFDADLDVQTYVQLMLSAKQAASRSLPLWVVV
jgi:hypothetical protein